MYGFGVVTGLLCRKRPKALKTAPINSNFQIHIFNIYFHSSILVSCLRNQIYHKNLVMIIVKTVFQWVNVMQILFKVAETRMMCRHTLRLQWRILSPI